MSIFSMKGIVGAALLVFTFAVGGIVLFGRMGGGILFETAFFALALILLVIAYASKRGVFKSKLEHVAILAAVLALSVGIAASASALKDSIDAESAFNEAKQSLAADIQQTEFSNNYYERLIASLTDQFEILNVNNEQLEKKILEIRKILADKKPIVIETIIEVPEPAPIESVPVYDEDYRDDERKQEEEDD